MTEDQKRRLNASVIQFVNLESERQAERDLTDEEVSSAYMAVHGNLVQESGATFDQVLRMITYTLLIGYPQDPFLVCEFEGSLLERLIGLARLEWRVEDLHADDPVRFLTYSDLERIGAGMRLQEEEIAASSDCAHRLARLMDQLILRDFLTVPAAIDRIAVKYDRAIADGSPREEWMRDVEYLIAPARLVQPELDTYGALKLVIPKRIAVPVDRARG